MPSYIAKPMIFKVSVKYVSPIGNRGSQSSVGIIQHGNGSITGRVLENGIPVLRRVMLYERKTGAYAGQTRSGADGFYTFKHTNENLIYFVVSVDDNNDGIQYNLVGQDLISGNHDKRASV